MSDHTIEQVLAQTGMEVLHVNRGESEDYFRGYNVGYDAGLNGRDATPRDGAPDDDPWRSAYTNGYCEGDRDGTFDALEG